MEATPPPLSAARARHDLAETTWWLKGLLIAFAVAGLASLVSNSMQLALFLRGSWTPQQGEANDARQDLVNVIGICVYLVTVIAFARWVLLANRHVRTLGAEGLTQTPWKATGFFFVPVVNLFLPYRGMRELWQASHHPSGWKEGQVPVLLPVWWGFWLVTNLFGRIGKFMNDQMDDLPSGILATQVQLVQNTLMIILGVLACLVVTRITAAQLRPAGQAEAERTPE